MAKVFTKLTRPAMRKMTPGETLHEHGISFERGPSGDGVFTVNVMVNGRRIHRVVGRESDGVTRTQAEAFIEQLRTDARHERLALPKRRKFGLTFREAAAGYLERLAAEGGKDLKMKRQRLSLHLVPFFDAVALDKITTSEIERYKQQRRHEQPLLRPRGKKIERSGAPRAVSPATVNRELAVLSHLFTKAVEWEWLDRAPPIRRFREGQSRIEYLTVEQARRLLECAKIDDNPHVYPFVLIGLETGMRRAEILTMRREHVDLARRVIFVPQAKAGAREQPITAHLAEFLSHHLAGLPADTLWVFPSPTAQSGHATDIGKGFRRAVAAAGLDPKKVVRHTLRHTAITHLVQAGVDLPTVKRISGHRTLAMVERYAHQNGSHIEQAMDKLQARYSSASQPADQGEGTPQ